MKLTALLCDVLPTFTPEILAMEDAWGGVSRRAVFDVALKS